MQLQAHLLGAGIGCIGVLIYIISNAYTLEEHFGLDTLFQLRGVEQTPEDVVVIALEKSSSDSLNLPNNPAEWPRDIHARLINKLNHAGAASITFDLFFKQPRSDTDDHLLSQAIQDSGKVILVSLIQRTIHSDVTPTDEELAQPSLNIEKIVSPIPLFAEKALAVAPFALPKYPIKVTKFWAYRETAGDIPNIPAVTLQLYCQDAYEWLRQQLKRDVAAALPTSAEIASDKSLISTMMRLRSIFNADQSLSMRLQAKLQDDKHVTQQLQQKITALINLYRGDHRYYINFYGPPWNIRTIPYYQALSAPIESLNLRNKAVFVGFSERIQPEQKDNFNTVYSQPNGLDLSGVEIAATAFENLLHNKTLSPLRPMQFIVLIFLFGYLIAYLARLFKPALAINAVLIVSISYLVICAYLFKHETIWLPWVVPVLFLTPLTLFVALSWHYFDAYRDRKHIRAAFGMYLPDNVVTEISKQRGFLGPHQKVLYGIVLATDAEEYTSLAEKIPAAELGQHMNHYYELLFRPVRKYGGVVSDVVGDAMMAIWSAPEESVSLRQNACNAVIEIRHNLNQIKDAHFALKTRIGLHAGEIALGNVGAVDHFEYRAVGDIVNTASRIESFNKQLGTKCLASAEVIKGTTGLLHRKLGTFTLYGKTKPIELHEILGLAEGATDEELQLCHQFAEGVAAYQAGDLEVAGGIFTDLHTSFPNDGPCQFYVELCNRAVEELSIAEWNSVISINSK